MRDGAADVPVRRLVRSQCVYVTVGTTRTAMKVIVLMTTLPLYSTHEVNWSTDFFLSLTLAVLVKLVFLFFYIYTIFTILHIIHITTKHILWYKA